MWRPCCHSNQEIELEREREWVVALVARLTTFIFSTFLSFQYLPLTLDRPYGGGVFKGANIFENKEDVIKKSCILLSNLTVV